MPTKPQHARRYAQIPLLLRELRENAGLTQRNLANQIGQPQSWVHKSEAGSRRVDLAEFCDWCVACEVKPQAALRRFLQT